MVISADEGGLVEYWQPTEPFELPKNIPGLWSFKTTTDLYDFKKVCYMDYNDVYKANGTVDTLHPDLYHPLARLDVLCYLLASGSSSSHFLNPLW
jgi:hypothetical protein